MKKITGIVAALIAFAVSASASVPFSKLAAALQEGCASFSYSFVVASDVAVTGSGKIDVQGACFRSSGNGLDVYCDGSTVWTVDTSSKEVVVESAQESEMFSNPAQLLSAAGSGMKETASKSVRGGTEITLEPLDKSMVKSMTVVLSSDAKPLIMSAKITASDGSVSDIKVSGMSWGAKKGAEYFRFNTSSLPKGWLVTDLR